MPTRLSILQAYLGLDIYNPQRFINQTVRPNAFPKQTFAFARRISYLARLTIKWPFLTISLLALCSIHVDLLFEF